MDKILVFVSSEPKVVASATTLLNHSKISYVQEIEGSGYIAPNSKYLIYVTVDQAERAAALLRKFPSEALHPTTDRNPTAFDIWFGRIQLAIIIGFVVLGIALHLFRYLK